ncbi:MAG: DUF1926 domain-containing protein [Candidatus Omnitrophica bacterium]|nr:DUF1926 domain-containing protein [Candidatus Omnitrophota bacterium]MDD5351805.1 DUF1926 domain-containing protein [Candidatus Omnitrophota bacterium]MDD5550631.1 DUF1926 domain-containing protein [Candidatus Omnitrophota bacterium]
MQSQDKKVNLLIAIHCHQPVSNFAGIFQDAFEKSYLPFLDVLEDFNNIKASFHYSGSLLDWLIQKHPEFIERLKLLVKEKRIEIIGGGYYEPILTTIPFRDAIGQIEMFREKIKEIFDCEFKGAWLTERVWEPKLPYILNEAKVNFTIVDDSHFKNAGKDPEKLNGYYLSEDESKTVLIFPGSERLRYLLPFKLPHEAINYLRERLNSQGKDLTITFADDGEKFGLWPGTNKWVYREGWLHNFFAALEESKEWINTLTFSEFIKRSGPTDRVYLPCASYREMQEWSGGFFRNFFVKYPEANNMQKKMFFVSDRLNELEKKNSASANTLAIIKKHLYMGQFNDAYWHGIFGGLYLNHLRSGVYEHLIKAENLIEEIEKYHQNMIQCDFDKDGKEEIIIFNKKMRLCFRPQEGATISEWDDKLKCFNLTNTVSRRFEHYHKNLKEKLQQAANIENQGGEPKSIHDQKQIKDTDLDKFLIYDRYSRYSLRDYLLEPNTKLDDFYRATFKEIAQMGDVVYDFTNKSDNKKSILEFSRKEVIDLCPVKLTKTVTITDNLISVDYLLENFGVKRLDFLFGAEFNFSLYDSGLCVAPAEEKSVSRFVVNDLWKEVQLEFSLSPSAGIWSFPVETVSDSESGVEKTYQELCVFFNWPVSLDNSKLKLKLEVKLV